MKKTILILFVSLFLISCTANKSTHNPQNRLSGSIDFRLVEQNENYYSRETYDLLFEVSNGIFVPNQNKLNSKIILSGYDEEILSMDSKNPLKEDLNVPMNKEGQDTKQYFEFEVTPVLEDIEETNQKIKAELITEMYSKMTVPICVVGDSVSRNAISCSFDREIPNFDYPIILEDIKYSISNDVETIMFYFSADDDFQYLTNYNSKNDSEYTKIIGTIDPLKESSSETTISFRLDENNDGVLVFELERPDSMESYYSNYNIHLEYAISKTKLYDFNIKK